jgi:hypothetical protein
MHFFLSDDGWRADPPYNVITSRTDPDIEGLSLALADSSVELSILKTKRRRT